MQFEILQEMAEYRVNEGDDYLKPDDVLKIIKSKNLPVSHKKSRICWSLAQLESYGYLEVNISSYWIRRYRVKSKYLNKFSKNNGGDEE